MGFVKLSLLLALLGLSGLSVGCRSTCSSSTCVSQAPPSVEAAPPLALHLTDWRRAVAQQPMTATDNIVVTPLGRTASSSHHLVRVRDREPIHIHAKHDLTVFVLAGTGRILLESEEYPCLPGEVLQIPRGQVHSFINAGTDIAVAYVIFSPPFDGQDRVIVPRPTRLQ